MKSCLTRRYHFQSVHSLTTGLHREIEHGHGFGLEVSFLGGVEPARVDAIVREKILSVLHARNLNSVLSPATGEVLVEWAHARLLDSPELSPFLRAVCLQETRKNRFVSSRSEVDFV
jgi:hypothetical protein